MGEPVRLLDGGTARVVALRTLPGVGPMWDLSLGAVHTFAVGDVQAVVHNTNCLSSYAQQGGHHIYAKAAFRGDPLYDPNQALTASDAQLTQAGAVHIGPNSVTSAQRAHFDQLADDVAAGIKTNSLQEHTRIAVQSLMDGGVPQAQARSWTAEALWQLRSWGITGPSRIPWN